MDASYAKLVIVALVVAAVIGVEPVASVCGVSNAKLMACKPAVTAGKKTVPKPSQRCCSALSGLDFACVCRLKASQVELAQLGVDRTAQYLAMKLPAKCNLNKPVPCA